MHFDRWQQRCKQGNDITHISFGDAVSLGKLWPSQNLRDPLRQFPRSNRGQAMVADGCQDPAGWVPTTKNFRSRPLSRDLHPLRPVRITIVGCVAAAR